MLRPYTGVGTQIDLATLPSQLLYSELASDEWPPALRTPPRTPSNHRIGQPSRLRTFTAITRTSSCSSVREKLGVAGNAEAARVNSTAAGSPTTAEGTQRPSIRSPNWSWIAAAHARHVFFEACGSDAEAPWRSAQSPDLSPPVRFSSSSGLLGIHPVKALLEVKVIVRLSWNTSVKQVT